MKPSLNDDELFALIAWCAANTTDGESVVFVNASFKSGAVFGFESR